ncbi:VOC family protein [Tyzzerella sp. OttesenSCG-928-J15]|nr:VOC family protein [Tyzzerella sp. OttesenSCG-928-J15]
MDGIVHTGITVKDLNISIPFYRDILGLELLKEEPQRASRGEKLGVPGAVIKIAVFAIPGSDQTLELIQYIHPEPPNDYGMPVNALGQAHIAFRVKDIDKTMKRLISLGVNFVSNEYETITDGPLAGWKWIYFKDPDGTNMELIED